MTRLSVRSRLLLAFLGIAAFAVVAAAAALYSFGQVERTLTAITADRMPAAVAALELSRQAERVVAGAPTLVAAPDAASQRAASASVAAEITGMAQRFVALRAHGADAETLQNVERLIAGLDANLIALNESVTTRLVNTELRERHLKELADNNAAAQRLVALGLPDLLREIERGLRGQVPDAGEWGRALSPLAMQQTVQVELTAAYNMLINAALAPRTADVEVLRYPLERSFLALQQLTVDLDNDLRVALAEQFLAMRTHLEAPNDILSARIREINAGAEAARLVQQNTALSLDLIAAAAGLAARAQADIALANDDARSVQLWSTRILLAVVALSLISSALIVWLYVGRNLIARLTALSSSMLAIAGGNLRTPVPVPGNDELGEMARALIIFRETAIEIEEKHFRELHTLLESIDYGVLILGPDLRVRIHNRAYREMSGVTLEFLSRRPHFRELIEHFRGRNEYDVADEDWEAFAERRVAEVARGDNPAPADLRLKNGRVIQFRCLRVGFGDRMLTYYDLTQLKQQAAALRAATREAESANHAKDDFLASMSHDLRTPLNAIIGYGENMLENIYGAFPELARGPLERLIFNGRDLLGLINDVLDHSKIEAGKLALEMEDYSVPGLVESVIAKLQPLALAAPKCIELRARLAADLPLAHGDVRRMRQVLNNLVGNAIKFTDQGFVEVAAAVTDGRFQISVKDSGPGIDPEDHELIFEKYQQVDERKARRRGGTGLGLYIARRIVEAHQGVVRVDSRRGSGATFTVDFPVRAT